MFSELDVTDEVAEVPAGSLHPVVLSRTLTVEEDTVAFGLVFCPEAANKRKTHEHKEKKGYCFVLSVMISEK